MQRILVIDDLQEQREHAIKSLPGTVITADGWEEGSKLILNNDFDVVLTDLSMPGSSEGQGYEGQKQAGKPTPYGFSLAMLALKRGVPKVAIISNGQADANHHSHPIYWSLDKVHGVVIPDRLWLFAGYDCPTLSKEDLPGDESPWRIKDWSKALRVLNGALVFGKYGDLVEPDSILE